MWPSGWIAWIGHSLAQRWQGEPLQGLAERAIARLAWLRSLTMT
jgi:hypothetical protein